MRRNALTALVLALFALLAACTDGDRMRRELQQLQQRNVADSLLTDSLLAMRLTRYFDRHGNQAERLLAHYLLARTWTDLGQAPQALDEYHRAAEQADTSRLDSLSHHWLSRIYGHMGQLLYNNHLPYNALHAYEQASRYAYTAKEPMAAIAFTQHRAKCFYLLNEQDSVSSVLQKTYRLWLQQGDTLSANICLGPLSFIAMENDDFEKAKSYLDLYEHHSHIKIELLDATPQWYLLYYYKGCYFLGINQPDSALSNFHTLQYKSTLRSHICLAYQGFYKTYEKLQQPDSASRYAMLYAQENDSIHQLATTASLLSLHHLYDYNAIQAIAHQQSVKAHKAQFLALFLIALLIVFIVFAGTAFIISQIRNKARLRMMNSIYVSKLFLFAKVRGELESQINVDAERHKQLQKELEQIKAEIENNHDYDTSDNQIEDTTEWMDNPLICNLHLNASYRQPMNEKDWVDLRKLCNEKIPHFMDYLIEHGNNLDLLDTKICILTKLHFTVYERYTLLDIKNTNLSKRRNRLHKKLIGTNGSTTEFDEFIHNL